MSIDQQLAFIFPGQGSQHVGMMAALSRDHSIVRTCFQEASDALNYDLLSLCVDGPDEKLNQTEYTQPALLAAGVAVYRLWTNLSTVLPAFMAGHSLGEYTALVCAGSLDFAIAVNLVAERGCLMQEAVPAGTGAMAAIIGLEPAQVELVCKEAAQGAIVSAANINAIGQIVISGEKLAVERAVVLAKEQGAKLAKLIPVSVPSHCALMRPAAEKLLLRLADTDFLAPRTVLIHNADVKSHNEPQEVREVLAAQLYSPVRWVETIQHMVSKGVTRILELGPGKILAGLNKRIDASIETLPVYDDKSLEQALEQVSKEYSI
ncbi:MAG: ACP S-malonyltransferase [Gammaproteobacteria bacterium]|nr:ACP S-malonyltransferase [Gammaproteobacteria bacterium]